jgi:SAM (Sterile alpha motif) domain-containing protein
VVGDGETLSQRLLRLEARRSNLGNDEYEECFSENEVDLSVLPHLTDHDLKELGV